MLVGCMCAPAVGQFVVVLCHRATMSTLRKEAYAPVGDVYLINAPILLLLAVDGSCRPVPTLSDLNGSFSVLASLRQRRRLGTSSAITTPWQAQAHRAGHE